jgi:hypothetical protein
MKITFIPKAENRVDTTDVLPCNDIAFHRKQLLFLFNFLFYLFKAASNRQEKTEISRRKYSIYTTDKMQNVSKQSCLLTLFLNLTLFTNTDFCINQQKTVENHHFRYLDIAKSPFLT